MNQEVAVIRIFLPLQLPGLSTSHLPASADKPLAKPGPLSKAIPALVAQSLLQSSVPSVCEALHTQSQTPTAEVLASITHASTVLDAQQQHTMRALTMLFPQEVDVTQPAWPMRKAATQPALPDMAGAQPGVPFEQAFTHSGGTDAEGMPANSQSTASSAQPDKDLPAFSVLPQSHAMLPSAAAAAITAVIQQQMRMVSPASTAASVPFTGPAPDALAQQQQQKQPQQQATASAAASQPQLDQANAAFVSPLGSLQQALSAEQIALLQAAADNAQRYLDGTGASVRLHEHHPSNQQGAGKQANIPSNCLHSGETELYIQSFAAVPIIVADHGKIFGSMFSTAIGRLSYKV